MKKHNEQDQGASVQKTVWTAMDCTGLYWAVVGCSGLQWALLGSTVLKIVAYIASINPKDPRLPQMVALFCT